MTKRIGKLVASSSLICFFLISFVAFCGANEVWAGEGRPDLIGASARSLHDEDSRGSLWAFMRTLIATAEASSGSVASMSTFEGQSSTLLPDGRVLLLGGERGSKATSNAYIQDPIHGTTVELPTGLRIARYGHTATILPNGEVLIFGGIGFDGKIVQTAEIFDPTTLSFTVIATPGLTPRAFHSATLLTDGRVLIAGGLSPSGSVTGQIEYWNYLTHTGASSTAELLIPRGAQSARLEANGTVVLWGGIGADGEILKSGEIFNPANAEIVAQTNPVSANTPEPPVLTASIPTDGAQDVALDVVIALRFSRALQVGTVNKNTVILSGPEGTIPIKIIPAEKGMLAFVTPQSGLLPGTQYELAVFDARDPSGAAVPDTVVRFTTLRIGSAGESLTAVTPVTSANPFDSAARKLPPLRAPKGVTAVSGQVLQLNGAPLPNTTLQIGKLAVHSDKSGRFLLKDVPSGHQVMWIVGTTADSNGQSYGIYEDGVNVIASQTNVLSYTIWMTPLDTADEVTIPSPTTSETVVSTPLLPGLQLHVPPGLVIKDWYGNTVTRVGITLIPTAQPPFPLPAGVRVPTYFTIQPGGAYFETAGQSSSWTVGAQPVRPPQSQIAKLRSRILEVMCALSISTLTATLRLRLMDMGHRRRPRSPTIVSHIAGLF